jgi:toxin ParE1/3/4
MPIRWTPEAADDLDRICSHIAKDSPESALKIGRMLYRGIARLDSFPNLGRAGRRSGTRELVFTPLPYIVVYRNREQSIEILHVWHGAQNKR